MSDNCMYIGKLGKTFCLSFMVIQQAQAMFDFVLKSNFVLFGLICANFSVKYNVKVIRRILEILRENSANSELGVG